MARDTSQILLIMWFSFHQHIQAKLDSGALQLFCRVGNLVDLAAFQEMASGVWAAHDGAVPFPDFCRPPGVNEDSVEKR